ncbi:hypothetical protein [Spirosoma pulveris]
MENLLVAKSETVAKAAVTAESNLFEAIRGVSHAGDAHGAVVGINDNQTPTAGPGVYGQSSGTGVWGESQTWMGVYGHSRSTTGGAGVMGENESGAGVIGKSKKWVGLFGETFGTENGPAGVWADGHEGGSGVKGHTSCPGAFGVAGFHLTNQGPGIYGKGAPAGLFEGDVTVTGMLSVQGTNVLQRIVQTEQQVANVGQLVQRVSSLETRINTLQQQVTNLQQQLASLQQKQAQDVQGIAVSLATLASRVTALGG